MKTIAIVLMMMLLSDSAMAAENPTISHHHGAWFRFYYDKNRMYSGRSNFHFDTKKECLGILIEADKGVTFACKRWGE